VSADHGLYLGQAEEADQLEEGAQGTCVFIQTLNLVDFLIRNGPASLVSNFKYEIYTLKSFFDYTHFSDLVDRGEGSTAALM
jgi:hypothetical protein